MDKTKVVVLCGSSRFCGIMAVCAWLIERDEKAIAMGLHLLPGWYCAEAIPDHLAEHEGVAAAMDELHLRKIDICDEIFVVNYDYYVGESTEKEVRYAQAAGKGIRWFTHDPIGQQVRELMTAAAKRAQEEEQKKEYPGQKCRVCGCTEDDCRQCVEAQGYPCHWVEVDLCSRCTKGEKDGKGEQVLG
ncbi:MAG: hypothetical protein PHS17_16460 [Desulfobacterales bacterium]|nr:hypothetical protein [Desulfobacterales bacterium]